MTLHNVPWTAVCRCNRWARCRSRARPPPSRFSRWWSSSHTNEPEFRDELSASPFSVCSKAKALAVRMRQCRSSEVIVHARRNYRLIWLTYIQLCCNCSRLQMAHRVVLQPRSNLVAFGAKRTLSHAHRAGFMTARPSVPSTLEFATEGAVQRCELHNRDTSPP